MYIPIQSGWFDSDIKLNETINMGGNGLVHRFFRTWEEAQDFAKSRECQAIQRVWSRKAIEGYNWTAQHYSGRDDNCPDYIVGTIKLPEPKRYW